MTPKRKEGTTALTERVSINVNRREEGKLCFWKSDFIQAHVGTNVKAKGRAKQKNYPGEEFESQQSKCIKDLCMHSILSLEITLHSQKQYCMKNLTKAKRKKI
jgi:hypothetical protein